VLEEVLPRLEELANQQRSLSKSLAYSRHTTQELKQLRSQQHDLGKGLATVARALTHLIDPPDVRATRAPQSGRQSSARVDTLVKALGPHAPRMGHMVRQWFGSGGGFQKSFDKELAAKMLAAGQLSAAEMVRWKKYNRLPDHCRASA
jgi:hypothetical protein